MSETPLITNDAVVLGILLSILAFVFLTASSKMPFWKKFYTIVPSLLMCYFLPSILNSIGLISGDTSNLYFVASRYLLPSALVLLTLSTDLKGMLRLGPKAVTMFLTGTVGVMIGGPLAILTFKAIAPDVVAGEGVDAVWRGLTTVAGSWIGGGANQTAMKEVFEVGDQVFSAMVAVDVIVANVWMAFLLFAAGRPEVFDRWLGADASAIEDLKTRIQDYQSSIAKMPTLTDSIQLLATAFGITALAHFGADLIAPALADNFPQLAKFSLTSKFFWLISLSTAGGVALSFTSFRKLEGVGASRIGSVFIYVLVTTIGMKMNIMAIFENPGLFAVGLLWITIHAVLLIVVARLIRAPVFFLAVGSQANIGGAASAPIVASAFHPALAPVGVLMAVVGYILGTYGAWLCGQLMRIVST
jgi:uncharacterized membrane protein